MRWWREKFPAPAGNRNLEPRSSSSYPSAIIMPTLSTPVMFSSGQICTTYLLHSYPEVPFPNFSRRIKAFREDKCKVMCALYVWGSGSIGPLILNLGTRWKWVVSFTLRPLYPAKRATGIHWIGGWVGPTAGTAAVTKTVGETFSGFWNFLRECHDSTLKRATTASFRIPSNSPYLTVHPFNSMLNNLCS
jgi:hypothetical protein